MLNSFYMHSDPTKKDQQTKNIQTALLFFSSKIINTIRFIHLSLYMLVKELIQTLPSKCYF